VQTMATAKQRDELTECAICTEVYTDPRVLPCVHTFCLKCIEGWSKEKQQEDKLACPLCRKEVTLSSNGVRDLPKNFFIQNSLQMRELSSVESQSSPCETCSGGEVDEKKVATVYCVECQQKICQTCEQYHKKFKATRQHSTVNIGDLSAKETYFETLSANCEKHTGDPLRIYCLECKLPTCTMCFIEAHNSHKWSDVNKVAETFRDQMASDVQKTAAAVEKCREMLRDLHNEMKGFEEQIVKSETEINKIAERLKKMIDVQKAKLLSELKSMKQKRMKEIESLRDEIERQLVSMESYKKYVDEIRQKGTACDVARAASGLHDRANEQSVFDDVTEHTLSNLGHADVTFTSSNFVFDDVSKTLGKIHQDINKTGRPIVYTGWANRIPKPRDPSFLAR